MKFAEAFTMIELIFIIVIVGILAAVAIPKIERNGLIEAADQITSHIRYTQQLAMNDNKFNANDPNWQNLGDILSFGTMQLLNMQEIQIAKTNLPLIP